MLYAKVSIITEKLEPSKSKSVKFEFERRKSLICALISSKSKFVNCVKAYYLVGSSKNSKDCTGASNPMISKSTFTLTLFNSGTISISTPISPTLGS